MLTTIKVWGVGGEDYKGKENACEMKHNNQEGIIMSPLKTILVSILIVHNDKEIITCYNSSTKEKLQWKSQNQSNLKRPGIKIYTENN